MNFSLKSLTFFSVFFIYCLACKAEVKDSVYDSKKLIKTEKVWVFIMAGQSNMAGRGAIEAQDTITSSRILSINHKSELILAKEPLHFYEPKKEGTDCGLAFAKELLEHIPSDVTILLLPTAVGGSSINQWLKNSTFRGVPLLSNFGEKVEIGKRYGAIKAVLWHQGESDANPEGIKHRQEKLELLFSQFRIIIGGQSTPILIGELGSYSKDSVSWAQMNEQARRYAESDCNTAIINTSDLQQRGDFLHFNSASQRVMGKRFAKEYIRKFGSTTLPGNNKIQPANQPVVVLTFDDAIQSHYTVVAPLLKKYNFGATFFICEKHKKGVPDSVNFMLWPQISQLNKMGFEIGNHTGHHKGVGSLTRNQLKDEIRYIEDKCSEYGIPKPISFAYPGNRSDSVSQIVLHEMDYRYARSGGARLYNMQTDNPLVIPSYTMGTTDPQRALMVKNLLNDLQPGQILVFTIHGVPDTGNMPYSTSPEIFTEYLQFMHDHNFKVIALRDVDK